MDEFDPDRWDSSSGQMPPFFAFGYGPRRCPGEQFAYQEISMCIAMLLRRYELSIAPNCNPEEIMALTLMPVGLKFLVQPVSQ